MVLLRFYYKYRFTTGSHCISYRRAIKKKERNIVLQKCCTHHIFFCKFCFNDFNIFRGELTILFHFLFRIEIRLNISSTFSKRDAKGERTLVMTHLLSLIFSFSGRTFYDNMKKYVLNNKYF